MLPCAIQRVIEIRTARADVEDPKTAQAVRLVKLEIKADVHDAGYDVEIGCASTV